MARRVRNLRCPTCKKRVLRNAPEFPFCSERCRLIDLGRWASGAYVVSTPVNEGDQYGDAYTPAPAQNSEKHVPRGPRSPRDDTPKKTLPNK